VAVEVAKEREELSSITRDLIYGVSVDRVALLERLASYRSDEEVDAVYHLFLSAGEPGAAGIRWLVRYLLRVATDHAFMKIIGLAQSAQPSLREEGRGGMLRIDSDRRLVLLIEIASSGPDREASFAIDWLGATQTVEALDPLLEIYMRRDEELVRIRAIRAVGNMATMSALVALEGLLPGADEKMEQVILHSLGQLVEVSGVRVVLGWLRAEDPRLRTLAAFKLMSKRGKYWERFVARELSREPRTEIKLELLSAIARVQSTSLFDALMQLALSDPSGRVQQMAQSSIRRVRSRGTLERLLYWSRRCSAAEMRVVLQLLSDYPEEKVVDRLIAVYQSARSNALRFTAVETIGECGSRRALDFLLSEHGKEGELGAALTLAITRLANFEEMAWIEQQLRDGQSCVCAQLLLHLLRTIEPDRSLPETLQGVIGGLVQSKSSGVRYLAIRLLIRCDALDRVELLASIALSDPKRVHRQAAERTLFELTMTQPYLITGLLELAARRPSSVGLVLRIQRRSPEGHLPSRALMLQILRLYMESRSTRLIVLLREVIERSPAEAMAVIGQELLDPHQLQIALFALNLTHLHEMGGLDPTFLLHCYREGDGAVKQEVIRFLSRFEGDLSEAKRLVFDALYEESDPEVVADLHTLVAHWVGESRGRG